MSAKKNIHLIGGAGLMGAGIVRDLLSDRAIVDIGTIRVFDLSANAIDRLKNETRDERLEVATLDVSDRQALLAALKGGDICINAVPTMAGFQMQIFEAALEARAPYLDLGGLGTYTVLQKAADERFRAAGVCAVIGVGADPGMSNVLCRFVADQLDTIDKLNLFWAAELVGPENPVLVPPYSVSTVLAEYALPSTQFLEGRYVEVPPMSGVEIIDLPEPWNRCEFMYSPHSEQLTVPVAKGIAEKGIQEFTWKLHLPHREHAAWAGLVKAGFGNEEPIDVDGVAVQPTRFLVSLINRNIEQNRDRIPEQSSHEIHFVIGTGAKDGRARRVRGEVIVRPNAMYAGYVDAATSMNGSIAAQLMLTSRLTPGVWAPEEFFETRPYFAELKKRAFEVRLTVEDDGVVVSESRAA
ncbi:saccharopine dehydrogenase family protein [Terrarubrum flagellatum]|uniref:saccharopine dehydrogenase family protein n=1 Tax=Terrirubrum flagellatum TaxID=2895980 RepID=UPI0031456FCE